MFYVLYTFMLVLFSLPLKLTPLNFRLIFAISLRQMIPERHQLYPLSLIKKQQQTPPESFIYFLVC